MNIDWLHMILGVVAVAWMIAGPVIAKRNVRLAAILGAVIQGVEQADHGPTKLAIASATAAEGIADHLDAIVQDQTKGGGQ